MQDLANRKFILKSPAKINLHLEVIGKREDGFHELAMIMQNIDLTDYLEFQINNEKKNGFLSRHQYFVLLNFVVDVYPCIYMYCTRFFSLFLRYSVLFVPYILDSSKVFSYSELRFIISNCIFPNIF